MPFNIPYFCPELSDKLRHAIEDYPNAVETMIVESGDRYGNGHVICSSKKLFTHSVLDSNVVTLFAGDLVGMSHYPSTVVKPEHYLPRFIEEITRLSKASNISAVPVAGDYIYHRQIKQILAENGVTILGEFCDNLSTDIRNPFVKAFNYRLENGCEPPRTSGGINYEGITNALGEKLVLATPETREVLLYSCATLIGNRILTPQKNLQL